MIRILLAVMFLVLLPCFGFAHDWFTGKTDKNGHSCCSGSDCVEINDGDWWEYQGGYYARWRNGVVYGPLPVSEAQPSQSKAGKAAACVYNGALRCFFPPLAY